MTPSALNTLEKLVQEGHVALSTIGAGARRELETWGERTGCLRTEGKGRGAVLKVVNRTILENHLRQILPMAIVPEESPSRFKNLARNRDTKVGESGQDRQYSLFKVRGGDIKAIKEGVVLDLSAWSKALGCLALELSEETPAWQCEHPLLLVENQALFDHTDWLPQDWQGVLVYYGGMLSRWLLDWIARSSFASVELFPDYDGVGLKNFARLRGCMPSANWHWRTDWEQALDRFGNPSLWAKEEQRKSVEDLWGEWETVGWPDEQLRQLISAMRVQGRMLEQEWVLPGDPTSRRSV